MTKRTGQNPRETFGVVGAVLMLLLVGSVVGLGASAVSPRVFTGPSGSVLLFDNETEASVTGIEVTFDAPVTLGTGDVIAFGGSEASEVFTWADSAWIGAELSAGGTLQVTLSAETAASVVEASWSADPLDKAKALAKRAFNVWNTADLSALEQAVASELVAREDSWLRDLEAYKLFFAAMTSAFPNLHFTIDEMIAEGNKVASRYTISGTNVNSLMGIPPTGEPLTFTGMTIQRFEGDKLIELWGNSNSLGLLEQLGVAPPSGRTDFTWGEPVASVVAGIGDPEQNKAISRRCVEEIWNQRNLDLLDELVAADFVYHDPANPMIRDLAGYKLFMGACYAAFPDLQFIIEDMLAEGDKVVVRWTFQGTHQGELIGIPPTGKQVAYTGILFNRLADGKLVETWVSMDIIGMLRQLGVIPSPGG